jgi:methylated-DNA-protein-cysteine methyltransferase-like protein
MYTFREGLFWGFRDKQALYFLMACFFKTKRKRFLVQMCELNFFEKCYQVAKQIPFGRVTSYGAIAKYLGTARSARMVGWAMNASHRNKDIPAHRVVNRKGLLTGKHHFQGAHLMQQLLESEGIFVVDNQIQNFQEIFWDPSEELQRG